MFVLLDGLDEYEGQKIGLVQFISSFKSLKVKICVASRGDPPFPDAFECYPTFAMHKLNTLGIEAFAIRTWGGFFGPSQKYDLPVLREMAKDVAKNAKGVFLWARFAIFRTD